MVGTESRFDAKTTFANSVYIFFDLKAGLVGYPTVVIDLDGKKFRADFSSKMGATNVLGPDATVEVSTLKNQILDFELSFSKNGGIQNLSQIQGRLFTDSPDLLSEGDKLNIKLPAGKIEDIMQRLHIDVIDNNSQVHNIVETTIPTDTANATTTLEWS